MAAVARIILKGALAPTSSMGGKYANSTYVYGYYQGNQWIPGYDVYTIDYSTNLIYGGGGRPLLSKAATVPMCSMAVMAPTESYGGGSYYYYDATNNIRDHDVIYGRGGDDRIDGRRQATTLFMAAQEMTYIYGGLGVYTDLW